MRGTRLLSACALSALLVAVPSTWEAAASRTEAGVSASAARLDASVVVRAQRLSGVRRRGLLLGLGCSERCRIGARLLVDELTASKIGTRRLIGRAGWRLAAGQVRGASLRLGRKVRRRLRRVRSADMTLRARVTDSDGHRTTVVRVFTLR